jgi:hypothetical protein
MPNKYEALTGKVWSEGDGPGGNHHCRKSRESELSDQDCGP